MSNVERRMFMNFGIGSLNVQQAVSWVLFNFIDKSINMDYTPIYL